MTSWGLPATFGWTTQYPEASVPTADAAAAEKTEVEEVLGTDLHVALGFTVVEGNPAATFIKIVKSRYPDDTLAPRPTRHFALG